MSLKDTMTPEQIEFVEKVIDDINSEDFRFARWSGNGIDSQGLIWAFLFLAGKIDGVVMRGPELHIMTKHHYENVWKPLYEKQKSWMEIVLVTDQVAKE